MMSSLNILFGINTNIKGLLTASANIGGIIGGLFSGHVVNRWGRKTGILLSALIVLHSPFDIHDFGAAFPGVGYGARSVTGQWSWRIIYICMSGPAISCIILLPFIPESPRWLISRGQEATALVVLAEFHGDGDEEHPLAVAEFREIKETIGYEEN
ncbi:hexose transporter [Ophiostoma piceae UAMH 11346]|uniref:Hexose transporter n=1 Tax=Ophiostoma piceae (strain UAMH 11346) TaxID=1262450 RepID=S3BP32_OPHP1|nr:hexose transporter [Ophiostoma piceae UAMH 11346]